MAGQLNGPSSSSAFAEWDKDPLRWGGSGICSVIWLGSGNQTGEGLRWAG